jgi:branched-chain amino acid transport system substrate-binding protein
MIASRDAGEGAAIARKIGGNSLKTERLMSFAALATILALGFFWIGGCPGPDESSQTGGSGSEIPVGVYVALTGPTATFGQATRDGAQLAADEVNARGGILGRRVRLIVEDNLGRPDQAVSTVTKLITRDNVIALIGENASSRSLAAAPIAQSNQVPMISPSSTNPEVTEKGDYIFRVCYTDPYQGAAIAEFVRNSLGLDAVAILKDIRNDYSVGLAQFFRSNFEERGGRVVAEPSYAEGDADFRSQLTAIRNSGAQAIIIPGYYTDVGQIARQARELGIRLPLVGGDGWDSPKLLEIGGAALDGSYFANHYFVGEERPAVREFVGTFQERFRRLPDSVNALSYDAARILFEAIERAGEIDKARIRDEIAATSNFQGVSGVITIGPDRNPIKPVAILSIRNGEIGLEEWVEP